MENRKRSQVQRLLHRLARTGRRTRGLWKRGAARDRAEDETFKEKVVEQVRKRTHEPKHGGTWVIVQYLQENRRPKVWSVNEKR